MWLDTAGELRISRSLREKIRPSLTTRYPLLSTLEENCPAGRRSAAAGTLRVVEAALLPKLARARLDVEPRCNARCTDGSRIRIHVQMNGE